MHIRIFSMNYEGGFHEIRSDVCRVYNWNCNHWNEEGITLDLEFCPLWCLILICFMSSLQHLDVGDGRRVHPHQLRQREPELHPDDPSISGKLSDRWLQGWTTGTTRTYQENKGRNFWFHFELYCFVEKQRSTIIKKHFVTNLNLQISKLKIFHI